MTIIPLSVASIGSIVLGFSCIIVTCTEPLIRVANKYNFYLFPENDFFEYTPSSLHIHSQNLFIATAVFLGITFVFSVIDVLAEISGKEDDTHAVKGVTVGSLSVATILYLSAVSTLGRTIYNVVDYIENLPLPLPPVKDIDVIYKWGFSMGTIGLISTLLALVLSSICLHQVSKRRSYVQLP
jgi:hypothetical protein